MGIILSSVIYFFLLLMRDIQHFNTLHLHIKPEVHQPTVALPTQTNQCCHIVSPTDTTPLVRTNRKSNLEGKVRGGGHHMSPLTFCPTW